MKIINVENNKLMYENNNNNKVLVNKFCDKQTVQANMVAWQLFVPVLCTQVLQF